MKNQAFNPYLPSYEYIPDAEPHIFGDRVYIYGSHDRFNGISFCLNDYVCWSAPTDDLSDWRYEGVIYRRRQDPNGKRGIMHAMFAPDVCKGADGRYYLYYFVGYTGLISVAVCDEPAGKYEFFGYVKYADGTVLGKKDEPLQFDPGVFIDDDGRIYMFTGFGPVNYPAILLGGHKASEHGAMGFELESDMLTIKQGPIYIGVKGKADGKGTPYEGHEFFEASSLRKFGGRYYFIYSSFEGHELCYAVSDSPLGQFELVEDMVRLNKQTTEQSGSASVLVGVLGVALVLAVFLMTAFLRRREYAIYKISGYSSGLLAKISLFETAVSESLKEQGFAPQDAAAQASAFLDTFQNLRRLFITISLLILGIGILISIILLVKQQNTRFREIGLLSALG